MGRNAGAKPEHGHEVRDQPNPWRRVLLQPQ
jgi:hypothetical protein